MTKRITAQNGIIELITDEASQPVVVNTDGGLRITDGTGTDYVDFVHNGTDLTISGTNTLGISSDTNLFIERNDASAFSAIGVFNEENFTDLSLNAGGSTSGTNGHEILFEDSVAPLAIYGFTWRYLRLYEDPVTFSNGVVELEEGTKLRISDAPNPAANYVDIYHDGTNLLFEPTATGSVSFNNGLYLDIEEQADPAFAADAGRGKIWVRDDAPNTLMFTDDAGTDFAIVGGTVIESAGGVTVLNYNFNTSTAFADPGAGNLGFNNANLSLATTMFVSDTDADGNNVQNTILNVLQTGDRILFKNGNSTITEVFFVDGTISDSGVYHTIPVSYVDGTNTTPTNGESLVADFGIGNKYIPEGVNAVTSGSILYWDTSPTGWESTGTNITVDPDTNPNAGRIRLAATGSGTRTSPAGLYFNSDGASGGLWFYENDSTSNSTGFFCYFDNTTDSLDWGYRSSGTERNHFGHTDQNQVRIYTDAIFQIEEKAAAGADTAAYGQIWVQDDAPNRLMFTDDTGQDFRVTPNRATVQTTDATQTEIITIPVASGTSFGYRINIIGNEAATGDTVFESIFGAIHNQAGTTAIVGSDIVDRTEDAGAAAWTVTVAADDGTDSLTVDVTGEAAHTIDWKVSVELLDV